MIEELSDDERALLDGISKNIWRARREGALLGALYSLLGSILVYGAFVEFGPTSAVSAACYGGISVVAFDAYRRLVRRP